MRTRCLLICVFLLLGGCAKQPPTTRPASTTGPELRGGPQTIKESEPFTVVADVPGTTNVDLYRLYQDGALWKQQPVGAVANGQISFVIPEGLKAGSYSLNVRAVNAEPAGEREQDVTSDNIIALTVVGAPPPPKFTVGQRIQVYSETTAGAGAAVRQPSFGFSSPVVGVHPAKHAGAVLDGPQSGDGYIWYRVDYDATDLDGWTTELNLDPCTADECKDIPPSPVDCVVTEWSIWEPVSDEWSACSAGKQTREEYRHRDVTTHPANGGALCPVLEEKQTVEQPCAVTLPAPTIDQSGTSCRWRFRLENSPDGTTGWTAQLQKGEKLFTNVGNSDSSVPYIVTTPYQGGNTTATFSFRLTKAGRPEQRTALITVACGIPEK